MSSPKSRLSINQKPKVTWVEPSFCADIAYRDTHLKRATPVSSFKGSKRS